MLGHGLDAVDAGAQIHPVQVQLENLLFGELRLDHHRDRRFLHLSSVGAHVRQEQRARELLRQRAAALEPAAGAYIADHGTSETDRVDARVVVEAAVFDGDDGVLQVGRDLVERDVVALLVETEPGFAIGAVEDGIADAARETVHRNGVARHPDDRRRAAAGQQHDQDGRRPFRPAAGTENAQPSPPSSISSSAASCSEAERIRRRS